MRAIEPRCAASGASGSLPPGDLGARGNTPATHPLGRKVLITEDNWLIASDWEAALEDAGYAVLGIAVSADEALELCGRQRPDFILMDVRLLGERDGVEAAQEARARFGTPSVFISAHGDVQIRQRAAAARPLGWLLKPVISSQLPSLLTRLGSARN